VPNLGLSELIVILMILLLVFGASRLPKIGESLGRTLRGFKRGMASDERIQISEGAPQAKSPAKRADSIAEGELVDKQP
jgi:sec-independent protein translocase protein TatA